MGKGEEKGEVGGIAPWLLGDRRFAKDMQGPTCIFRFFSALAIRAVTYVKSNQIKSSLLSDHKDP